jgi:membrane protein
VRTSSTRSGAESGAPRHRRVLTVGGLLALLGDSGVRWVHANAGELAAAIAFNALLSLAPLLLLLMTVAARVLGSESARTHVMVAIETVMGPAAAPAADALMGSILRARGELLATTLGVLVMVHFSSAVFLQLRGALNRIWGNAGAGGIRGALMDRLMSLVFVPAAVLGFLLTMALGFMNAALGPLFAEMIPRGVRALGLVNATVSFVLLAVQLAFLFRHGPSAPVRWRDVWGGALLTALLFTLGNSLIGLLLGRNLLVSMYGAAGALVVVLLWVYYWAQILLFGAHFTRAYAERYGSLAPAPAEPHAGSPPPPSTSPPRGTAS